MIELIFSKVKDKKTILSIRLTNKHFYNIFKDVIDNENKKNIYLIKTLFKHLI